jgi:hypothetical protein
MLTDAAIHIPPNYESFSPPFVGERYADPVFGSSIKRLSNAFETHNAAGGGNLTWIEGEYSTPCPFNSDNSLLVLVHESYFGLYGSSGLYLRDLPLEITASSEPRWSRVNTHTLYYVCGNQLKSFDVTSGVVSVVHTFGAYSAISGCGESDISMDGDHFVFAGDRKFIFVYQISTDTVLPSIDVYENEFDSLYLTPLNNVLISWLAKGTAPFTGIELYDKTMVFQRQVFPCNGHKDTMLDADGSEILVIANSDDPTPVAQNAIVKVRLSDGKQAPLLSLDWSLAVHISTPDNAGFAYVETYAPSNPQAGDFKPYTNELLKIPLDGSPVQRLAHHRSRPNAGNTYNWQPKMSCSRDGSRFIFASNYNAVARQGVADEYADVYMIQVVSHPAPGPPPPRPHPPAPPRPPHPNRKVDS